MNMSILFIISATYRSGSPENWVIKFTVDVNNFHVIITLNDINKIKLITYYIGNFFADTILLKHLMKLQKH